MNVVRISAVNAAGTFLMVFVTWSTLKLLALKFPDHPAAQAFLTLS